jgi:hypothetical protein
MCATTFALTFLLASAAPTPSGSGLQKLLANLEQSRCEEAFLQLGQVEAPADAERIRAGLAIARGAQRCRSTEPAIALEISSLAFRLAPQDPEVALGHAEMLLAADQRGEAAALLDRLSLPRAQLLRGRLAVEESDFELAIRSLEPLGKDPTLKEEVAPLLEKSREGRRSQEERARVLREAEASTQARLAEGIEVARERQSEAGSGTSQAEGASHAAGDIVASFPNRIGRGGSTSFVVNGLTKGRPYRLESTGHCKHGRARCRQYSRDGACIRMGVHSSAGFYGLDFRVQLGSQPSRSLPVGQGREEQSRVSFMADSETITIRVFDESNIGPSEGEVVCNVGGFAVVAE